jgi:RNA polymerase sigma-70 factor, ECF subfamily
MVNCSSGCGAGVDQVFFAIHIASELRSSLCGMPDLSEDHDLLVAFREGHREALEQVYDQHVHEVAKLLRSGFGYQTGGKPAVFAGYHQPYELENAVQEVFTRAFAPQARLSYDGLRPYGAFLHGIARHVVLDRLRRLGTRRESIELVDTAGPAPEYEDSLDERRGHELVQGFLREACDQRDRTLFALRFEDDLSQLAAAGAAGLTRIQVRRWETKFRARLLRYLKRARYARES